MANPENGLNRPAFDIDKVYNNGKFLAFLAKHPDAEDFDSSDAEAVETRFIAFEAQAAASKGVFEVLAKGHVMKELGIELDPTDAHECIEEYIMNLAIENPEEVAAIRTKVDAAAILKSNVASMSEQLRAAGSSADHQAKLDQAGGELSDLNRADSATGLVMGTIHNIKRLAYWTAGVFSDGELGRKGAENLRQTTEAKSRVEQKYGDIDVSKFAARIADAEKSVKTITEQLNNSKGLEGDLDAAKKGYERIREDILQTGQDSEQFTAALQDAVLQRFAKLDQTTSFKDLAAAQSHLETLSEENETGVDMFEKFDAVEIQKQIDDLMEKKAEDMIWEAIGRLKVTGGRALDRLENDLKGVLDAETIGSKDAEETRWFLRKTLNESVDAMTVVNPENTMKKLVIRRIIETL